MVSDEINSRAYELLLIRIKKKHLNVFVMEVRTSPKYQKFMRPGKTIERIRNSKDFFSTIRRNNYRYWTNYYGLPVAGWNAGNDGKDYINMKG